jgi:hypothetical protein
MRERLKEVGSTGAAACTRWRRAHLCAACLSQMAQQKRAEAGSPPAAAVKV